VRSGSSRNERVINRWAWFICYVKFIRKWQHLHSREEKRSGWKERRLRIIVNELYHLKVTCILRPWRAKWWNVYCVTRYFSFTSGVIFVEAFAKSRKVPIGFVRCVRPSVRMYQHGFCWTNVRDIRYWGLLLKTVRRVQILLKSDKNIDHFTWRTKYALLLLAILNGHESALSEIVSGY
jgi:hypothetical protein